MSIQRWSYLVARIIGFLFTSLAIVVGTWLLNVWLIVETAKWMGGCEPVQAPQIWRELGDDANKGIG